MDVLGRLAELYECSVGDLLLDYADFRDQDAAYNFRQEIDHVHEVVTAVTDDLREHGTEPGMVALVERLDEMDVHEFGRLSATLAQQVDVNIDRRALFLKLAAGLSLAAVAPVMSTFDAEAAQAAPSSTRDDRFAGFGAAVIPTTARDVKLSSSASTTLCSASRKINYSARACRINCTHY